MSPEGENALGFELRNEAGRLLGSRDVNRGKCWRSCLSVLGFSFQESSQVLLDTVFGLESRCPTRTTELVLLQTYLSIGRNYEISL